MANPEHLKILKKGVYEWNEWRIKLFVEHKILHVDPSGATILGEYLSRANLSGVNLSGVNLSGADLSRADLSGADLSNSGLSEIVFRQTNLKGAHFNECFLVNTTFSNIDLSEVKGLESVNHRGPSSIGIDTIFKSQGKIPEVFLRGCGIPEDFIHYIPSFVGATQSIQYYSCFISYSTKDEEFVKRLHSRMRDAKLRVWFAPEDIEGGKKIYEQIETAIQLHDRLLLVLSEGSMQSEWVITEIRRALKVEKKEGRRKLFPIRLVEFDLIKEWELIDADSGKDLAVEIRSYFIPNFSNWKDHDSFERAFERLLKDLRAEENKFQDGQG